MAVRFFLLLTALAVCVSLTLQQLTPQTTTRAPTTQNPLRSLMSLRILQEAAEDSPMFVPLYIQSLQSVMTMLGKNPFMASAVLQSLD